MSTVRITYLYCDGCDHPDDTASAPFDNAPHPTETAADQRERAKRSGWTRRDGKDYCAECSQAFAASK